MKKEAEEARKRMLKEKRNLRKQLLETQKQEAGQQTTKTENKREDATQTRGGAISGRGRGRWRRRGCKRWTQRY